MICESCNNEHTGTYGSGRFCSRACANRRSPTSTTKNKVSRSLVGRITGKAFKGINECEQCGTPFEVTSVTKTKKCCSANCVRLARQTKGRANGMKSASVSCRRSKNEVLFAEMCTCLGDVITNVPMFNGWDADVILPTYMVAVLWNGPWHYRKLTQKHSVAQVQNRDAIKLKEIATSGYTAYVIRDNGSHDESFVHTEFVKFKTWIGEIGIPRRS